MTDRGSFLKSVRWSDWLWSLIAGCILGALLTGLDGQGHLWSQGWLAYGLVSALGLGLMAWVWRQAGSLRWLGILSLVALGLRLVIGVGASLVLPTLGTDSQVQKAGYLSVDAYHRDQQAWELAGSPDPILKAFDKRYAVDQYGGLEALSALVYRYLSPDAHRPWLVILLAALASALGVVVAYRASRLAWNESLAIITAWIMAFYPESLLWDSSQMREPFLLTFIAMSFLGLVLWRRQHTKNGWGWLAAGLFGLLLFSPGIALFIILLLAGWTWLERREKRISWVVLAVGGCVLLLGMLLLWAALARGTLQGAPLLAALPDWFKLSVKWDVYQLERDSGMVQYLFRQVLPPSLKLPFVFVYGLLQPVLPAAIFEPSKPVWMIAGILRSLGWYLLLPLLAYSLVALLRSESGGRKWAWVWLYALTWVWISLSSLRAGGDQWDNPRYRLILLLFEAALVARCWLYYRETRDAWLPRLVFIEMAFLIVTGWWYAGRYTHLVPILSFSLMAGLMIGFTSLVLAGGVWWDWRIKKLSVDR